MSSLHCTADRPCLRGRDGLCKEGYLCQLDVIRFLFCPSPHRDRLPILLLSAVCCGAISPPPGWDYGMMDSTDDWEHPHNTHARTCTSMHTYMQGTYIYTRASVHTYTYTLKHTVKPLPCRSPPLIPCNEIKMFSSPRIQECSSSAARVSVHPPSPFPLLLTPPHHYNCSINTLTTFLNM